jgi:hypothetical protein
MVSPELDSSQSGRRNKYGVPGIKAKAAGEISMVSPEFNRQTQRIVPAW